MQSLYCVIDAIGVIFMELSAILLSIRASPEKFDSVFENFEKSTVDFKN